MIAPRSRTRLPEALPDLQRSTNPFPTVWATPVRKRTPLRIENARPHHGLKGRQNARRHNGSDRVRGHREPVGCNRNSRAIAMIITATRRPAMAQLFLTGGRLQDIRPRPRTGRWCSRRTRKPPLSLISVIGSFSVCGNRLATALRLIRSASEFSQAVDLDPGTVLRIGALNAFQRFKAFFAETRRLITTGACSTMSWRNGI